MVSPFYQKIKDIKLTNKIITKLTKVMLAFSLAFGFMTISDNNWGLIWLNTYQTSAKDWQNSPITTSHGDTLVTKQDWNQNHNVQWKQYDINFRRIGNIWKPKSYFKLYEKHQWNVTTEKNTATFFKSQRRKLEFRRELSFRIAWMFVKVIRMVSLNLKNSQRKLCRVMSHLTYGYLQWAELSRTADPQVLFLHATVRENSQLLKVLRFRWACQKWK